MGIKSLTDSQILQDQLYPELNAGRAEYHDEGHWATHIDYIDSEKTSAVSEIAFPSRDKMLFHIQKERFKENRTLWRTGKISTSERYAGFEKGLVAKIVGIWHRMSFIISERSVDKGLYKYDLMLLGKSKTYAYANYSAKEVRDFHTKPILMDRELERLGIGATDLPKLATTTHWLRNGPAAYTFIDEEGQERTLQSTVTSSSDRNSPDISMARRVDDLTTQETISYTGRPDTRRKAEELIRFMVQSEMSKELGAQKGLRQTETGYEFTFLVNNLMTSNGVGQTGLTFLAGFDERESILMEKEILETLSGKTITVTVDGEDHAITINPLYFNQGFNFAQNLLGTPSLQRTINQEGYAKLFALMDGAHVGESDRALLNSAKEHLRHPSRLRPEEEFFYRDLVAKILKIPTVDHCKSSTDRTTLALAISQALQGWRNIGREIPIASPHSILSTPEFKELFMANVTSGHQVTRVSRSSEGIVRGNQQLSRVFGFVWGGNGKKKNPIVIRMLPDRYLTEDKKKFDLDSPFFRERSLIKPKKMKAYYRRDHSLVLQQNEELERIRQAHLRALRTAPAAA